LIAVIQALLIDCKLYGTKPFSILARCAFIAEELLRSLQRTGILTSVRVEELKQKTPTILSEFIESVDTYDSKNSDFLEKFGHLRPGTYDILSPRYDSFIEEHIEGATNSLSENPNRPHQEDFELSNNEKNNIEKILKQEELDFSAAELISFIQRSISYREWGKLHFTKNLSDALECLADLGKRVGLSREDVSHISIHNILKFAWNVGVKDLPSDLKRISVKEKEDYELTKALRFPSVISKVQDLYVAPLVKARPNFVTHKRVDGEITFLSGAQTDSKLNDRIIIIEGADPGYDWIFLHSIKGLITKYGGTNSHMAIRCAEIGIPAVIGCGEQLFDKLKSAQSVSIDCEAHTIRLVN
jgi:phosphohistidine swiveling domain-containing protein